MPKRQNQGIHNTARPNAYDEIIIEEIPINMVDNYTQPSIINYSQRSQMPSTKGSKNKRQNSYEHALNMSIDSKRDDKYSYSRTSIDAAEINYDDRLLNPSQPSPRLSLRQS